MSYYNLFKAAVAAVAVGVAAYGAYRGYTSTRTAINNDKIARKNAASAAKVKAAVEAHRKTIAAVAATPEATVAFEEAVVAAKAVPSVATDVKVASFRTGFVCGEEEIIRASVAMQNKNTPVELARKSFYAAIVTAAKNHKGTCEEFSDNINNAIIQSVEQAVATNKISVEQLHLWINSSDIEHRSFYVPTLKDIRIAANGTDVVGLIDRLIKLDMNEEERIRKLIEDPGDKMQVAECEIDVTFEMAPA